MQLKNKVAVITGGGTGIGKATALLFAREGAKIVIAGRRKQPLRQTVEEITRGNGEGSYCATDITDSVQVRKLFDDAAMKYGRIDVLFNNAGAFLSGKEAHDFSEAEWDSMLNINFRGTMLCSKYVVSHLQKSGGGSIINCTSVSGNKAQGMQAPYNVSKAAVEMMSKCMALDLGKYNIRVNTVCPSLTETDMAANLIAKIGKETFAKMHPLQRIGTPVDIAHAALYLASDNATWVSGMSMFVDGGYTCK
jgi:NAD(P)-dependent dehydrogenase (short-subunit alcohol dehydrogenase family)